MIQKIIELFKKKEPPKVITSIPKDEDRLSTRPIGDINAPMEIYDSKGHKICTCRLTQHTPYQLKFERLPGEISLPILNERDLVQIRGYTKNLQTVDLQGSVSKSNRLELTIGQLHKKTYSDSRTHFRQPVNQPAKIYKHTDKNLEEPIPCQLINISETGACVETNYNFEPDTLIMLRVELYPGLGPISFQGQIVREKIMDNDKKEYGILFAQITQRKKHDLESDMEELRDIMSRSTYK